MTVKEVAEPKWLQIGYAKSGNFWLYRILQCIAGYAGIEQKSFIQNQSIYSIAQEWNLNFEGQTKIDVIDIETDRFCYTISSVFRMPIRDLDDYVTCCSHVWMHAVWGPVTETVLSKFTKVIYIVRDPRDVAVSLGHFVSTPYGFGTSFLPQPSLLLFLKENFSSILEFWASHVCGYLKQKERLNIHFVIYERLLADFDGELARLLGYLGISLRPEVRKAVREETCFGSMKSGSPSHLRKGERGQWREVLSKRQLYFADKFVGDLISIFQSNQKDAVEINRVIKKTEARVFVNKFFRAIKTFSKSQIYP